MDFAEFTSVSGSNKSDQLLTRAEAEDLQSTLAHLNAVVNPSSMQCPRQSQQVGLSVIIC